MGQNDGNLHEGHRKRLRERYIKEEGLGSFDDHQILELMLFYSYHARMDTNGIAHKILNRFNGSLIDLFNASPKEIMRRAEVSEKVAVQLSMVSELVKYYIKKTNETRCKFDSSDVVEKYVLSIFADNNSTREIFHLICLDKKRCMKEDIIMGEGSEDQVKLSMKEVIQKVLENEAVYVILAHNHPGGAPGPSRADLKTTEVLKEYLGKLGIKMLDHVIVSDNSCYSFAAHRLCNLMYK